ncbi:MAG: HlyD family type I secretion periplasmic adaptor subunit [Eubacteriales bacterium]|nr:HlyD family type I secretion periplasmic adaptor subunit [Eubacteriales bacterium]
MEKKNPSWLHRLFFRNRITKEDYARIEDENTPPPQLPIRFADSRRIIGSGLFIILLFFGIGGTWVAVAQITGAVIASGEVRVDTERKAVQHLEGGIIKDILVRNGDHVEAGQPLLLLDSSRVVSASDQLRIQIVAAQLDEARLNAEKNLNTRVSWPPNDPEVPSHKYKELLESARKVFSSGRETLENKIDLLRNQIVQIEQQDLSIAGRLKAEQQIVAALQEELDAKLILFEEQYIDKTRILELRRAISEHQGLQAQLHGNQAELREKKAEFQLRISTLENEYRQEAITRMSEVQQRLFDLQQQLLPLLDARQRLTVSAPVSGEIVALQVHSRGGVISPGQPLLDIVPKDSPLIVECRIMVNDITHLFKGQMADVELVAFKRRTTPKIPGKVVYISADRILQKTAYGEQPAYIVYVELDKQELAKNDLYVTPGMPAAVFIRTEPRTVLDYILEPLTANFDRALREN